MILKNKILKEIQQNSKSNLPGVSSKLLLLTLILQCVLFSCSTEKNAFINKTFHYTTAKFNGYFHGKEALKEGKKALAKGHQDNYEEILAIFPYGDKDQATAQASNFNRAIAKAIKMIDRHSMKFKKKGKKVEVNKMMDDCYFLLADAQFFKMQYDSAEVTYKYIIQQFQNGKLYYPAYLALVKTYIYQENFVDASTKFKLLEEDKNFPKKLVSQLQVLQALYFIETRDYPAAIDNLKKAIPASKGTKHKVRLKYILAQLYQATGKEKEASKLYEEVAKKAVHYEMEFNAKLSLAKTHEGKDNGKIINILNKMLKDGKNKDFKDQIYYTLAQVHAKQGDEELAVKNYKLSAQASINNPKQKALSYLAVADYHFKQPEYIEAQMFYDSSLLSLPEDFPNFSAIKDKADNLTELVKHLNIIQREDSLQRVANLSEEDRLALIDDLIEQVIEKEEQKEIAEQAKLAQIKAAAAIQVNTGGWLFDNPGLLASAGAEFITIFGDRKLEDNWRRSDRTSVSVSEIDNSESELVDEFGAPKLAKNKTVDFYLKELPFSEVAIDSSNVKIKRSLYVVATIFKDKLNDLPQANYYFEELNKRFPNNENRVKSLYQLYRNYSQTNQLPKAEEKKAIILSEFPNSEYALLIKNPNRGAEAEEKERQLNEYYQHIYTLYQQGSYDSVRAEIEAINTEESTLSGNFDLLDAFAQGKIHGRDSFEIGLRKVVQSHQGTASAVDAQVILDQIQASRMKGRAQLSKQELKEKQFDSTAVGQHYVVVIVENDSVNTEELLLKIKQLNRTMLSNYKAKVSQDDWNEKSKVMLVKPFENREKALTYEKAIQEKLNSVVGLSGVSLFSISEINFFKLNKFKELQQYIQFNQSAF